MRVAAFFYLSKVDVDGLYLWIELAVLNVHHLEVVVAFDDGYVSVFKIYHLVGIFHDGACVGTKEILVVADAYNKWTLVSSRNDGIWVAMVEDGYGVSAYYFVECQLHGCEQVDVLFFLYELYKLYEYFRIGVRHERDAFGLKSASEL